MKKNAVPPTSEIRLQGDGELVIGAIINRFCPRAPHLVDITAQIRGKEAWTPWPVEWRYVKRELNTYADQVVHVAQQIVEEDRYGPKPHPAPQEGPAPGRSEAPQSDPDAFHLQEKPPISIEAWKWIHHSLDRRAPQAASYWQESLVHGTRKGIRVEYRPGRVGRRSKRYPAGLGAHALTKGCRLLLFPHRRWVDAAACHFRLVAALCPTQSGPVRTYIEAKREIRDLTSKLYRITAGGATAFWASVAFGRDLSKWAEELCMNSGISRATLQQQGQNLELPVGESGAPELAHQLQEAFWRARLQVFARDPILEAAARAHPKTRADQGTARPEWKVLAHCLQGLETKGMLTLLPWLKAVGVAPEVWIHEGLGLVNNSGYEISDLCRKGSEYVNGTLGIEKAFCFEEEDYQGLRVDLKKRLAELPAPPIPSLLAGRRRTETAQPPRKRGRPRGDTVVKPGKAPRRAGAFD